jgi:formate hydrogenlyase subunit 3/multisubunit Na+/H+ antiporter MnhD subunit
MVTGALLGMGQWDIKRLLAYSSISQVGYICAGLGLAALLAGAGVDHISLAKWAVLGALLHLANHAVYKALLFLTSGSIEMATGTRQMDELGGLAERMPIPGWRVWLDLHRSQGYSHLLGSGANWYW